MLELDYDQPYHFVCPVCNEIVDNETAMLVGFIESKNSITVGSAGGGLRTIQDVLTFLSNYEPETMILYHEVNSNNPLSYPTLKHTYSSSLFNIIRFLILRKGEKK